MIEGADGAACRYSGIPIIPACEVVQNRSSIIECIEANSMRAMDIPSDLIFRMRVTRYRLEGKTLNGYQDHGRRRRAL